MARNRKTDARKTRRKAEPAPETPRGQRGVLRLWVLRGLLAVMSVVLLAIGFFAFVNPPTTPYMMSERSRLGAIEQEWVGFADIAPAMGLSAVAAEDANFCLHWGLDVGAIRSALAEGSDRGASTISQQVVKNVYLWHGRSWLRKALEAGLTPLTEAVWTKRRILEVYLNVAEFGEGIFGVEAAAQHYFGVPAADLTDRQAALLAAVLPDPKGRSPANPSDFVARRATQIADGAATIAQDGRAACFAG
jgi:monofunctional biosynthetic peptidoglycan transglycosylase